MAGLFNGQLIMVSVWSVNEWSVNYLLMIGNLMIALLIIY